MCCVHIQFAIVVSYHLVCGNYTKRRILPMVKIENINSQRAMIWKWAQCWICWMRSKSEDFVENSTMCQSHTHTSTHTITYNALSYSDRNSNYYQSNWWNAERVTVLLNELPLKHASSSLQLIFFPFHFRYTFFCCSQFTFVRSILPGKMCLVHTRANILSKHLWVHNSFNRWTSFCVTQFVFVSCCSLFVRASESTLAPMAGSMEELEPVK